MRGAWIWAAALVCYGAFSLWYDSWSGPLEREEIDEHLDRMQGAADANPEQLARLRAFLEADDGGEFFMLNLVRLHPDPVAHPESGAPEPADQVLARYTDHFMPALLRRAGHPAFAGRGAARYLEHWGVEPDPGWTFAGVIRYRSRRDLLELASDPAFAPAHAYKIAAIAHTLALPVAPALQPFGPRLSAALGLALLAALAQLALGRSGRARASDPA